MPATETTAQLGTLRSQVTRLEETIAALQKALIDAKLLPRSVSKPAPGERITSITTQRGRSRRRPAPSYMTTRREVAAPLSAHHPRKSLPDRFSASLVLADDLVGHVVGRGGRGLKQVADISSARVSVHSQEIDGHWERLVSIRGTDKQLGDALVVLGKRIARKRVTVTKKKKGSLTPLLWAMLAPVRRHEQLFRNPLPLLHHPRPVKRQLLRVVERAPLRHLKRDLNKPRYRLPLLPVGLW